MKQNKKNVLTEHEEFALKKRKLELMKLQLELQEGLPHLYGYKWYSWAREFFESQNKENFLCAANQISKDIENSIDIPTPDGFKKMGNLVVGDYVYAQDGTPTKIIAIPYKGSGVGFRITFSDGSSVICGPNHQWVCKTSKERFRKEYTGNWPRGEKDTWSNTEYGQWVVKSTLEIIKSGQYSPEPKSNWSKVSIPLCLPIRKDFKNIKNPYLLGLLLGDGCLRGKTVTITTKDEEISEYVCSFGAKRTSSTITYRMPLDFRHWIEGLGLRNTLSETKFIPEEYFNASVEERLALLRGLMDTDGTVSKASSKHVSFTSVSPMLAVGVSRLVTSLGGVTKIKRRESFYRDKPGALKKCQDSYMVSIKMKDCPFLLKRKVALFSSDIRYKHERIIEQIEPIGIINSTCITVDHPTGTFICTRDHIVTHNSSTQIRKCIDWATDPKKWPELWPSLMPGQKPNQFWYFYPTAEVAQTEFETKWEPQFMPRGKFKDDPIYGWKDHYDKNMIKKIEFNSGVTVYFKMYSQKIKDLQSGTVYAIFADEEMPVDFVPEIQARLNSSDGYFHMVFTATLGQLYWSQTMEPSTKSDERYPHAWKKQVSVYDCQFYEDGSPSHWTLAKIKRAEAKCPTEAEKQRRIFGRFVKSEGLMFPSFDFERNTAEYHPPPRHWLHFSGVDPGTGGQAHPAAIVFIAVSPDYKHGRVWRAWRGDGINTASPDIFAKYKELRGKLQMSAQKYDYASREFFLHVSSKGEAFSPAEKDHVAGYSMLNTLFRSGMLKIYTGDPETDKLISEVRTLSSTGDKRKAQDDLADALRYAAMAVPWDFSDLDADNEKTDQFKEIKGAKEKTGSDIRRDWFMGKSEDAENTIEDELDFWNEAQEP